MMREAKPIVFVVDDDPSIRDSLELLMTSAGLDAKTYCSAEEFLQTADPAAAGCLVLDIRMPGMNGFDLQERCANAGFFVPIIFITGHGNIPLSVRAMRAGAIDFLEKPFEEEDLLNAINRAIELDRQATREKAEMREIRQRIDTLSPREHQVFTLLVTGMSNKQVAYLLGTTERTIKAHRSRVMEKMKADSMAALARYAEKMDASRPHG